MSQITEVTPERLEWMKADLAWQPWAEKGWQLQPLPDGRVTAVDEGNKMAVEAAKGLETVVRRLAKGEQSYFHYMKFRKQTK